MSTGSRWWPVESFDQAGAEDNLVVAVDAIAGNAGASRFESVDRGRAIVVSVQPSAGTSIALVPPASGTTEILFLRPAGAGDTVDLLTMLGERGRSVRVALPPGRVESLGFVADPGCGSASTQGSRTRCSSWPIRTGLGWPPGRGRAKVLMISRLADDGSVHGTRVPTEPINRPPVATCCGHRSLRSGCGPSRGKPGRPP